MRAWFDHKTKDTSVICIPIDVGIGWGRVGSGLKQGWGMIGTWLGAGLGQGWGRVGVMCFTLAVVIGGGGWWWLVVAGDWWCVLHWWLGQGRGKAARTDMMRAHKTDRTIICTNSPYASR